MNQTAQPTDVEETVAKAPLLTARPEFFRDDAEEAPGPDDGAVHALCALRFHHGIGDTAHQVFAKSDLRVHYAAGGQHVAGRQVAVLQDGVRDGGPHEVSWDGRDGRGLELSAGAYFVHLDAGGQTRTSKVVLVK